MAALEFVRVTADGSGIVLRDAEGNESTVPMDERLLSALMPRELSAVDHQQHLTPREIQARVRAGADARALAEQAGMPLAKVMTFAQPILQERAHVANSARATMVRRASGAGTLDDIVSARLLPLGVSDLDLTWDARRLDDGRWQIRLAYATAEGARVATWLFDLRAAVINPLDDEAHWLMGEPAPAPARAQHTVTRPTLPVFLNTEQAGTTEPNNVYALRRQETNVEALIEAVEGDVDTVVDIEPEPEADDVAQIDPEAADVEEQSATEPEIDAAPEPVTRRPKRGRKTIPSWDEILFGPNGDE